MVRTTSCVLGALLLAGAAHAQSDPYLGEIRCGLWNYAPRGWALLQGQTLPINQNQALFSLLGTSYGGDGRTTFQLPDMRGRVLLSAGQGTGLQNYEVGQTGGSESSTLSTAQLPAHSHGVALPGSALEASTQSPAGKSPATLSRTTLYAPPGNAALLMAPAAVSAVGGNQPISNLQPYLPLTCVMALQGIYPSRD
jgi:microcystin-dependent protein|nr:tail fiber protein [uncultured Albidiferax sp.]